MTNKLVYYGLLWFIMVYFVYSPILQQVVTAINRDIYIYTYNYIYHYKPQCFIIVISSKLFLTF